MTKTEQIFIKTFKRKYGRHPNIKEIRIFLKTGGWIISPEIFIDIVFGVSNNLINAFDLYYTHDENDTYSATYKEEKCYNIEKLHVLKCMKGSE